MPRWHTLEHHSAYQLLGGTQMRSSLYRPNPSSPHEPSEARNSHCHPEETPHTSWTVSHTGATILETNEAYKRSFLPTPISIPLATFRDVLIGAKRKAMDTPIYD